jgi:hypothetical protein
MKHIYATEFLARVETKTRGDPVIHPHVVQALHEMAFSGTGYRELPLFGFIAGDNRSTPMERVLCLDVLSAFAGERWGVSPHVVTPDEKELAARMLKRLRADCGLGPGDVEELLKRESPAPTGRQDRSGDPRPKPPPQLRDEPGGTGQGEEGR